MLASNNGPGLPRGSRHRRSRSDGVSLPTPDQLGQAPAGSYGLPKSRLSSVRKAEDYGFDAIQEETASPNGSFQDKDLQAFSATSAKARGHEADTDASSSSQDGGHSGLSGSSSSSSNSGSSTSKSSASSLATPNTSSRTGHTDGRQDGLHPRQPDMSKPPRPNAARHRRIRSEDIVLGEQWNSAGDSDHSPVGSVSSPKHPLPLPRGIPKGAPRGGPHSGAWPAGARGRPGEGEGEEGPGLWDRRQGSQDLPLDMASLHISAAKQHQASPSSSPTRGGADFSPTSSCLKSPPTPSRAAEGGDPGVSTSPLKSVDWSGGGPRAQRSPYRGVGEGDTGGVPGSVGSGNRLRHSASREKEMAAAASAAAMMQFKGVGLVIPKSPYASPFTSPRHSGVTGPSPRYGPGTPGAAGLGSLVSSPSAMAAQAELDRVKLMEIQGMFQLKQSWQSPKVEGRGPFVAKPVRTPNVSDYYRVEDQGSSTFLPSMACVLQKPFRDISDSFRLSEKELGRGNFGVIRVAERRETGEKFACKTIAKEKLECWEDVEDVKREVQVMEALKGHPHIISIAETFEDHKEVHLIMELCEGGELFDRILERGYYAERQAAKVCRILCEVLEFIHARNIVHRDLKPENVLLISKKSDTRLKVIDFGMAILVKPGERCRLRAGTPNYIAPEVIGKNYAHEADVWSVGVILYVLLCGLPPFWGDTTEDVFKSVLTQELDFDTEPWPVVSVAAKDLVRRMLNRDYKKRLTASEVLNHPWIKMLT